MVSQEPSVILPPSAKASSKLLLALTNSIIYAGSLPFVSDQFTVQNILFSKVNQDVRLSYLVSSINSSCMLEKNRGS